MEKGGEGLFCISSVPGAAVSRAACGSRRVSCQRTLHRLTQAKNQRPTSVCSSSCFCLLFF